jgi:hypothetical protein
MRARLETFALIAVALGCSSAAAQTPPARPADPAIQLPEVSPVKTEAPPPIGIVPPPGMGGPIVSLTGCVVRMDHIETKRPLDRPVTTFFVLQHAADLKVVTPEPNQPPPSTAPLAGRTEYGLISNGIDDDLDGHRGHRVEVTGSLSSPAGLGPAVGLTLEDSGAMIPMIVRSVKMLDKNCGR